MGAEKIAGRPASAWRAHGAYDRFEQVVTVVLMLLISAVIAVSVIRLAIDVAATFAGGLATLSELQFEEIFGRIMTVLIALEFNNSILQVLKTHQHILQVRTVVLIAVLAIARKFIIIDLDHYDWGTLIALAVIIGALGGTYWLLLNAERATPAGSGGESTD